MDENEQCKTLESQIRDIRRQILVVQNELLEMYDSDHLNPIIPNYKKRISLFNKEDVDNAYKSDALKCCFYQTFMIAYDKLGTDITIAYPTKENEIFGVQLKQNKGESFSLNKYELPISLNPEKFISNVNQISLAELPDVLATVCRAIYAFIDRKKQTNKLKVLEGRIGKLSVSPCHRVVRIALPVESSRTRCVTTATVILKYNETGFRPSEILLYLDDSTVLSKKQKKSQLKKCNCFSVSKLSVAYTEFLG